MRKKLSSKKNNKKDEINYDETQLIPIPIKEPLKETIFLRPNDIVGARSGVLPKVSDLIVYPKKSQSLLDDLLSDEFISGSNYDDTKYNDLNSNNNGDWSPKFGSPERFGMNTPSTTRSLSSSVEGSPILSQEFDTSPLLMKDVKSNFIKIPYPASTQFENQTLESFTVGNPNSSLINMMRDLELEDNEEPLQSKTKKEKTLKKSVSTGSIRSTNSSNSTRSTNSKKSIRNKNKTKKSVSKVSKVSNDSISKGKKKNNKTKKKGGKRINKKGKQIK